MSGMGCEVARDEDEDEWEAALGSAGGVVVLGPESDVPVLRRRLRDRLTAEADGAVDEVVALARLGLVVLGRTLPREEGLLAVALMVI